MRDEVKRQEEAEPIDGIREAIEHLADGTLRAGDRVVTERKVDKSLLYWRVIDANVRTRSGDAAAALQTEKVVTYRLFDMPTKDQRMGQADYNESSIRGLLNEYVLNDIQGYDLIEPRIIDGYSSKLWLLSKEEAGLANSRKTFTWYRTTKETDPITVIRRRQKTDLDDDVASWWLRTKADMGIWLVDEVAITGELAAIGCNCCSGVAPCCLIRTSRKA